MTPKLGEMLSQDTASLETFDEASEREAYKALVKSTVRGGGCAGCGGASCASFGSASCHSGNCAGGCGGGGADGDGGIGSGGAL